MAWHTCTIMYMYTHLPRALSHTRTDECESLLNVNLQLRKSKANYSPLLTQRQSSGSFFESLLVSDRIRDLDKARGISVCSNTHTHTCTHTQGWPRMCFIYWVITLHSLPEKLFSKIMDRRLGLIVEPSRQWCVIRETFRSELTGTFPGRLWACRLD